MSQHDNIKMYANMYLWDCFTDSRSIYGNEKCMKNCSNQFFRFFGSNKRFWVINTFKKFT